MKPINLNRREKLYVSVAAAVIGIFLFLQLVIFPIQNKRERLERTLLDKTETLQEMNSLHTEYAVLEKTAERAKSELARREKNFSLTSFLNQLAGSVGIEDNIKRMDDDSSTVGDVKMATVEVKIETITMDQLSNYLYRIEYSGNNLFVKEMSISETSKPEGYINVVLQVETVES
jgi:general secretion pathway protein M